MDILDTIKGFIPIYNETTVYRFILISQVLDFLWERYLSYRQHLVYKKTTVMPDSLIGISKKDTFEKARLYALDKSSFALISDTFQAIINFAMLAYEGVPLIWRIGGNLLAYYGYNPEEHEILQGAAFMLIANTISLITKIPFSIYHTFVLEEKHGFNKQTVGFFIKDKIKSYILAQILTVLICSAITWIVMNGGKYFFIYLWFFTMVMTFFFMTIYPSVIAPLFDKYTPLPDGDLRTQIETLAASIDFPLTKLYVVEGSKRSNHSNAYFYGFFKNKRIVLFDTLLKSKDDKEGKGCDDSEVLAVLGHELGHWKLNHVLKNMIYLQINILVVFIAFQIFLEYRPMYRALGFFNSTPILVGFMILTQYVLAPYFFVLGWCLALVSRRFEFQADEFAKSLGRCYSLKLALIKLNADNLGFPIYDPLYSSWHNSHPPLLERLEALEKDKNE